MKPIYKLLSAACVLLMAGGCSDSNDWTPGPEDTETGVSAYFERPSQTSYVFDSSASADEMIIPVTVSRQVTSNAVSVPIILNTDAEGFSAPSAVSFAEGESSASFDVLCSGIPQGKQTSLTITLDPTQTDVYGIGLYSVEFSVIKADWIEIADNLRYLYTDYYSGANIYPATYEKLYILEGTHTFKLPNFFGSGLDVTFNCDTPDETVMIPLINADFENVSDDDKADMGWYLYDEANQTYPQWVPGGVDGYPAITYFLAYCDEYDNVCNMIYNYDTLYGYIGWTTGIYFDDDSFSWCYFTVDFNLNYNPFE